MYNRIAAFRTEKTGLEPISSASILTKTNFLGPKLGGLISTYEKDALVRLMQLTASLYKGAKAPLPQNARTPVYQKKKDGGVCRMRI